jgi:hypothetical protein
MAGTLSILPDTLTAGETLSVTVTVLGYTPDDGYTLAYRFAAPTPITAAGVDDEAGGWTVTLTATQTLTLTAGLLAFDALVTKAGVSTAVDRGSIRVLPSPLTVSKWQSVLTSTDAAIATWGSNENRSFSVDGMSLSYKSLDELLHLRAVCIREIKRDTGIRRPYRILSRFEL